LGSASTARDLGAFRFKAEHLARIQETLRIVAPLGAQLDVIFAVTTAVLDIVHMGISDEDSIFAAEADDLIQPDFGGEAHQRDRARDDLALAVLHELHVEENLMTEAVAEEFHLIADARGVETTLQIGERAVVLDGPERGVVPGVIGE
jgi:hypothetical protein